MTAQSSTPLILVSNDDGIRAPGIQALAERLRDLGEVIVAAPDRERSASAHAITLDRPLCVTDHAPGQYAIDGTPADCVYLGIFHLAPRRPSLVVSGINNDYNLGTDLFYSGTVAAAVEGAIHGVPAMALSLERGPAEGLAAAADFAHALAHAILAEGLPSKSILNVNIPNHGPLAGYRWTRLGERIVADEAQIVPGRSGRRYFYFTGGGPRSGPAASSDADTLAVENRIVSITPLELDMTSRDLLARLPGWRLKGFEAVLVDEGRHMISSDQ